MSAFTVLRAFSRERKGDLQESSGEQAQVNMTVRGKWENFPNLLVQIYKIMYASVYLKESEAWYTGIHP